MVQFQYINLILGKFGSNVFKTGANISYFMFIFSRYVTITTKKGSKSNRFYQKLSVRLFLFITLVLSVLINVYIIFEFTIDSHQKDYKQNLHMNVKDFSFRFKQDPIDDYKETFSSNSVFILLNVVFYLKMIFSDLAHIIVSTIVDILLFIFVKRQSKIKQSLINATLNSSLQVARSIQQIRAKKNRAKPNRRISNMIILNGINFIFLRIPLAALNFYGFIIRYDKFCTSLNEIFLCFYLLSFLIQFLIFYKLDTNFKLSIANLKERWFNCKPKPSSNENVRQAIINIQPPVRETRQE